MANNRPLSLQWRVTLLVGLVISLGLALLGWSVQQAIAMHFVEQDSHELGVVVAAVNRIMNPDSATALAPRASNEHSIHIHPYADPVIAPWLPQQQALQQAALGHHGIYWQLLDNNGKPLFVTAGPDVLTAASTEAVQPYSTTPVLAAAMADTTEVRLARVQLGEYQLVLASDQTFHRHFLDEFAVRLLLLTLLIGLLTLLAVWFSIHRGHAPLRQLSQQIGAIGSQHLHQRLDPNASPAELQALIESFNAMLARLEQGFERLSNFSADIAHELRTPLAALITQTQVALAQNRSADEYQELLYSSLEEEERLSRMVADMLWLAKTDNGLLSLRLQPLALDQEVADLMEFFEAWADEQNVTLSCEGATPLVAADRDTLRRAISNLLSNAIRHTAAGQSVRIELHEQRLVVNHGEQTFACISVVNPGAPIPPEHLPHLFERFYRVDGSRQRITDGTGLGLAITRSIAQLHGGFVNVSSDAHETRFNLLLPLLPEQNH
ncbi:heavy metal sensor histidine kinase [Parathalassolituus penaei]|uniref:Sensor protein n=1 Tax=Parathalassolituus penaei TaxID=2997323 RepID=A0A9X3EHB3_9GAMM|nr:heavy metal sensor histidine kinase [Parathalassolituus penaei]MCY0966715.1 heavy metal sensor histidine kinase [Parathalassolituus penaei]